MKATSKHASQHARKTATTTRALKPASKSAPRLTAMTPPPRIDPPVELQPRRLGALDAAALVLRDADKPLRSKEIILQMEARGLWKSPGGKTPEATLYAAMIREMSASGSSSRFARAGKGEFIATMKGGA